VVFWAAHRRSQPNKREYVGHGARQACSRSGKSRGDEKDLGPAGRITEHSSLAEEYSFPPVHFPALPDDHQHPAPVSRKEPYMVSKPIHKPSIYDQLYVKRAINARGIYSSLGGSVLSPHVWEAMWEANSTWASMADLLSASGKFIARLTGAEAARVTLGASGAIVLGLAACMTRGDGAALERLPDTSGIADEVLIQTRHRYRYDRLITLSGARCVEVGNQGGTTIRQLSAAITDSTAAIFVPAHLDGKDDTVTLPDIIELGHARDIPVFVDAAYLIYPIERIHQLSTSGADLVCFSAKYFGGPNSGGFVVGRPDLIEAIAQGDFVSFETGAHRVLGRALKLDRHTVAGVVAALQEWLETDHQARFESYRRRVETIQKSLSGLPHIQLTPMCFTMEESLEREPVNCLHIRIDPDSRASVVAIDAALRAGDPAILVHVRDSAIIVDVEVVTDQEAELVGHRLRQVFAPI
jgi:D-glucosaminate-6-phosphate ammonia-lyase